MANIFKYLYESLYVLYAFYKFFFFLIYTTLSRRSFLDSVICKVE